MKPGHREAQNLFLELGNRLGFLTRRTFSRRHPTDGIWLASAETGLLPVVAAEVVVSEGLKTMRGSVATLEAVSPALGVLVLQDEEIRRCLLRLGREEEQIQARIWSVSEHLHELIRSSRQRLEIWRFGQLVRRHELAGGSSTHPWKGRHAPLRNTRALAGRVGSWARSKS